MGRMSDLHIEVQETGDSWQEVMDRAVEKQLESDNQKDQYQSDVLSLDIKQIIIDEHNRMMANAKKMDKQMEEDDAK